MTTLPVRPLLDIALDLCANLAADDRYRRLVRAVMTLVPCDAAALLRLEAGVLVPVVVEGLLDDTVGRRFVVADHPRLAAILGAKGPTRFEGSDLPDPFDGLVSAHPDALSRVHACMGAPLVVEGQTLGVLAVDALDPRAFDDLDDQTVATLAALAGAAMRTAELISTIERDAAHQGLVAKQLQRDTRARDGAEILGQGEAARRLRAEVALIGASDLTVLVTGETGVGKDVAVRAIHQRSARRDAPLIQVNCAALPESIAESELFGHVRGAFTGANDTRAGKFEVADKGTLFLDEVGELPLSVQPKLLRALQSGEVQRVGSDKALRVDVRVIAATNRNLVEEARAGRFRADLYHRLAVYPMQVPPLRERMEDVLLLAGYFLDAARARLGLGPVRLAPDARAALLDYTYPGNVRELEHLALRSALRASKGRRHETIVVEAAHLGLEAAGGVNAPDVSAADKAEVVLGVPLRKQVEAFERRCVAVALAQSGGKAAEAARRLGMDRSNFHRLVRRLGAN